MCNCVVEVTAKVASHLESQGVLKLSALQTWTLSGIVCRLACNLTSGDGNGLKANFRAA